jgi:hypothetical protein
LLPPEVVIVEVVVEEVEEVEEVVVTSSEIFKILYILIYPFSFCNERHINITH